LTLADGFIIEPMKRATQSTTTRIREVRTLARRAARKRRVTPPAPPPRLGCVEDLEGRRLLAAGIDDRVLVVDGTSGFDAIAISDAGGGTVSVRLNDETSSFDRDDFDEIVVNGFGGDDDIETDGGPDLTLLGGDGDDLIRFLSPDRPASVSGGAGTDVIFLDEGEGTSLDLRLYPDVENALALGARQTMIGNDLDNHLSVDPPFAEVTLIGGNGNDTLVGSQYGDDSLEGGAGNDLLREVSGSDPLIDFSGDDTLDGGDGDDTLFGGDGDDELDGGAGTDTLFGGRGNDTLLNGEVTSRLRLDNGTLRFDGTLMSDEVFVSADGSDLVVSVEGDEETFDVGDVTGIVLLGAEAADLLELDASLSIPATLDGGDHSDTLTGGAGDDQLTAGGGTGFGAGENVLTGNDGDDLLVGGSVRDTLQGGSGDDTLDGGLGPDVMRGGAGRDTLDYSSRTKPLHIVLDRFQDDGEIGEDGEGDLAADDIEIVLGGSGHDLMGGTNADNEIHGMGGYDTINGGGGDDALFGWHGNDVILGGDGDDYIEAGAGHDYVEGHDGEDTILALAGNDWVVTSADGNDDLIIGGRGTDTADADEEDDVTSVETVV
jgi:Ca2+-binding RTX toxin-like protein